MTATVSRSGAADGAVVAAGGGGDGRGAVVDAVARAAAAVMGPATAAVVGADGAGDAGTGGVLDSTTRLATKPSRGNPCGSGGSATRSHSPSRAVTSSTVPIGTASITGLASLACRRTLAFVLVTRTRSAVTVAPRQKSSARAARRRVAEERVFVWRSGSRCATVGLLPLNRVSAGSLPSGSRPRPPGLTERSETRSDRARGS